jgi:very-short-patch-repair endonuclease
MRKNQIKNLGYLKDWRKDLRNNMTPAEAALWKLLKGKQMGETKFRRQHSIENYIADFYCAQYKLIIELDGAVHNNAGQADYDTNRDSRLTDLGYTVLRFENRLVFDHPEYVLMEIANFLKP